MEAQRKDSHGAGPVLLLTKLAIPRPRAQLVRRERFSGLLERVTRCKLTVVRSPAGFGKTTLIVDWLTRTSGAAAWVSLDEHDDDLRRFWSYVAAAVAGTGIPSEAQAMLASRQMPPIEAVLTDLLNGAAASGKELVLVLDDYHLITQDAIHASLDFLISHLPPSLHLVLLTREEPPLALASYRARAELAEVSSDQLRFNREEVGSFFRVVAPIPLSEEHLESITRITEGWAAAIQLVALSLEGSSEPQRLIESFGSSSQYLFDYLAEEVFASIDERLKPLMVACSLFDRFSPPLVSRIAASIGSEAAGELFQQENLFLVRLDPEDQWFRYHRLFREFLSAHAAVVLGHKPVAAVRMEASRWFRGEMLVNEAIEYALDADAFELAAETMLAASGDFFARSDLPTLRDWIAELPVGLLHEMPALCFIYAWALIATGRQEGAEPLLAAIERSLGYSADGSKESLATAPRVLCALAEIAVMRSTLAFSRFDIPEVQRQARLSLSYLPEEAGEPAYNGPQDIRATALFNLALAHENEGALGEAIASFDEALVANRELQNIHLVPMIYAHLANLHIVGGELTRAAMLLEEAIAQPGNLPRSPLSGLAFIGLGTILLERNQPEQALEHLRTGLDLGMRWANWEEILPGMLGVARALRAQGDLAGASRAIEQLVEIAKGMKLPEAAFAIVEATGSFYARHSDRERVDLGARARRRLELLSAPIFVAFPEAVAWVRVLLSIGEHDTARDSLLRIEPTVRGPGRTGRLIELLALKSVAAAGSGDPEEAARCLEEALELAEGERYIRIFLDLGPAMVRLLEGGSDHAAYRRMLLDALAPAGHASPVADLSERELEVLRALLSGLSNQGAAERLFVSVNTIKTHLKNIYSKLDVSSRAQAIARAAELGVSPASDERD